MALSERYGWTPDEIRMLTLEQFELYLRGSGAPSPPRLLSFRNPAEAEAHFATKGGK